jgi:hypothetical protein
MHAAQVSNGDARAAAASPCGARRRSRQFVAAPQQDQLTFPRWFGSIVLDRNLD